MGDDHGAKLVKSLRGAAQKYVGVGFFLGFFLVLLTYFTLSEQFAIAAPNAIRRTSAAHPTPTTPAVAEKTVQQQQLPVKKEEAPLPEHEQVQEKPPPVDEEPHRETEEPNSETEEDPKPIDEASKIVTTAEESAPAKKPACDIQGPWASDVCDLAGGSGGVRIHGSTHTVLVPPTIESGGSNPNPQEWRVLPYSRKHMSGIKEITVRELPTAADAPRCAVTSQVPALVFAMGGLTGNYWHDFSDVMIPLYLQASRFDGEVQLVVTNIQPWYAGKYRHIIARLSRYDVVDMGLKYMAYSCGMEESTLVDTLGRDHPAVKDPESIHRSGWSKVAEYYLGKQDVKLDLQRFEPVLLKAMAMLRE
uniref:Uncharacterized protein n=1 Tax=Triticum aestivum TaxID=4565 RepID=A0A3B6GK23_WHEAT